MEETFKLYQKTYLYSSFSIRLAKRNGDNNTHKNIVDESVNEIIPYKIVNSKFILTFILYFLTFGILYIFVKFYPKLYLKLNCVECDIRKADMFVIVDQNNDFHVTRAFYENFYRRNNLLYYLYSFNTNNKSIKTMMKDSPYLGEDFCNKKEDSLTLYYRYNKYIYSETKKEFESVRLDFSNFTNEEIHNIFGSGLTNILDYNYLLNKFGRNIIELEGKSFIRIFVDQLIHPFYLYQIFSVIIWIKTSYIPFCIVVIILAGFIILVNSYQNYMNYKKLLNFSYFSEATIMRRLNDENSNFDISHKLEILNNESQYIVPGDLIELSNNEIIPCDCILLDGYCTVNESDLTGESSLVMKSPLPVLNVKFAYNLNSKSILFHGTQIDKCESLFNDGKVRAIVINTGFNTHRGDFIQNVLFPKPTNFKFHQDILAFLGGVLLIYIAAVILLHWLNSQLQVPFDRNVIILKCLDLLTIIFPPSLPICMTFSAYYFHYSLNTKKISCINDSRMNAAGRVNIIVLDKTGTLTEDGLDLFGYQTTRIKSSENEIITEIDDSIENNEEDIGVDKNSVITGNTKNKFEIEFDEVETSAKSFNYLHREFWKKFCEEKITKDMFGDQIDSSLYNSIKSNKNSPVHNLIDEKENLINEVIQDHINIDKEILINFINKTKKVSVENVNDLNIISNSYKTDLKLNIIYFLECLATCHSIDKLNGNHFGNNIDRRIFDNLGWIQIRSDEEQQSERSKGVVKVSAESEKQRASLYANMISSFKYYMVPKKSYKINEESYFKNIFKITSNNNVQKFRDYKLSIIKRFEFSSKFQSMSVIVGNNFDCSYRFFIKGSPEKIISMCNTISIPLNFNRKLMEHTQNGFRVLACATKVLPKKDSYELESDRSKYENELTFLGFIIFKNKLKKGSKHIISKLNQSHCKLVMSTGDNPFTSISVARECEFIPKKGRVFVVDTEKGKLDKRQQLRFTYLTKNENLNQNEEINNKVNLDFDVKSDRRFLDKDFSKISNIGRNNNLVDNNEVLNLKDFLTLWKENLNDLLSSNSCICISGKAFMHILNRYHESQKEMLISKRNTTNFVENSYDKDYYTLVKLLELHGKIFYRMSPNDKVELVNFFKENKSHIVAMCGDGANDCGALLCADTGISIKHLDGRNITAHFYCVDDGISCIELIIKNGRACFENSKIIFEYMLLYAIIQLTSVLVLFYNRGELSNTQFLFIDLGVVLVKSLLISKTGANMKVMKDKPNKNILNLKFLLSITGQSIIQISTMIIFFFLFFTNLVDDEKSEKQAELSLYNSYLFIFTVFQYSGCIFALNQNAKHKKGIYSNKTYIIYASWIGLFMLSLITVNYFNQFGGNWGLVYMVSNAQKNTASSQFCKIITILFGVANLILTISYEILINKLFD